MSDQPLDDRRTAGHSTTAPDPTGRSATTGAARAFRYAVHVMPRSGILDPQGRAVERSMPHLGVTGVRDVRVGRRVELTVEAPDEAAARAVVERLSSELLANPLIETYAIALIGAVGGAAGGASGTGDPEDLA